MDKIIQSVSLHVSDGTKMDAYTVRPEAAGTYPGLLVFQEIFGVNQHIREVTERLAAQGYVAIAPDLFHRSAPGFDGSYEDLESGIAQASNLTRDGLVADIEAAFNWLNNNLAAQGRRIGSVGFCMGGRIAVLANAFVPLAAAVSYYGGVTPNMAELVPRLGAPMLFYWGGLDKHIPPEQHRTFTDAMKTAGKEYVDVEFSHADHGFFCDHRPAYNAQAAAESWALTLAFLRNRL